MGEEGREREREECRLSGATSVCMHASMFHHTGMCCCRRLPWSGRSLSVLPGKVSACRCVRLSTRMCLFGVGVCECVCAFDEASSGTEMEAALYEDCTTEKVESTEEFVRQSVERKLRAQGKRLSLFCFLERWERKPTTLTVWCACAALAAPTVLSP